MKRVSFLLVFVFFAFAAVSTFAQGGKAEPNEVKFAKGKSSAVLTGSLKGEEEMEYVFNARQGQKVTVTNTKSTVFNFRIFNDEAGYNSEDVSEKTFTFEVPETGDYMFFIKKTTASAAKATFSMTLAIK